MYVCLCRSITDHQIKEAVCNGAHCLSAVNRCFDSPVKCGRCIPYTQQLITETMSSKEDQ